MTHTREIYAGFVTGKVTPDAQFTKDPLPVWDAMDKFGDSRWTRFAWIGIYVAFYAVFAPSLWWWLLLPIHFLVGPVQGAVVNWCGHKYGYSNYDNGDQSRNSEPWGILLLGELFQNNHHKHKDSANFAKKWYEFDPTYPVMKAMHWVGIIKLRESATAKIKAPEKEKQAA
jgi:stearoyl-CoA desaturase (delta-9 desaturase)